MMWSTAIFQHFVIRGLEIWITKILFLVEHYTIKMDIIRYYLFPNSTALKLCNQKD